MHRIAQEPASGPSRGKTTCGQGIPRWLPHAQEYFKQNARSNLRVNGTAPRRRRRIEKPGPAASPFRTVTHPGVPGPGNHDQGERASRPTSGSRAGCSADVPPVPSGDRKPLGLTGGTPALPRPAGRRDAAAGIFRTGFCLPRSTTRRPQVALLRRVSVPLKESAGCRKVTSELYLLCSE